MSGKASRSKGKRGETAARNLLTSRDWQIHDLTDGVGCADFIAIDKHGCTYSVEVKNCRSIDIPAFTGQARRQAGKMRWLLLCHIHGTSSWLVMGRDLGPQVWHE